MTKGILGRKIGMTQWFTEEGKAIPVTVVEAGPCVVLQKKDIANDGYEAIQLGFAEKRAKLATKAAIGHAKKAGSPPQRLIKEFRGVSIEGVALGQVFTVDQFAAGEYVDVTATSKGRGTLGAIQRWNMSRGPMTHGSKYHRGQGSLAIHRDANRVPKGKKMAGRTGNEQVTMQNLEIIKVDSARNVLLIKGSIPGPRNTYVNIRTAIKKGSTKS
jgi:large subunit ribosomal protein L3